MAIPTTKQGKRQKASQVMHEFAEGELHSGSGATVKSPAQAKAIALSASGQSKPKPSRRPARRTKARAPDLVTVQRR